jgi:hypothetical protein
VDELPGSRDRALDRGEDLGAVAMQPDDVATGQAASVRVKAK